MTILVSNDDGIQSPGLHELVRALSSLGDVWVVAPDREQSAVGHSITLAEPIRLFNYQVEGAHNTYAISGSPADCVKLALAELLPQRPDVVVSGINRGENTGISIIYSGTVSAATEGAINGIPSVAVSLDSFTSQDYYTSGLIARRVTELVLREGLPPGTLLNVNVPSIPREKIRGVRVAKQGLGRFQETFLKRNDPRGRTYYWMDGNKLPLQEENTDGTALQDGYVAITPIHLDLTHHGLLETMSGWTQEVAGVLPS